MRCILCLVLCCLLSSDLCFAKISPDDFQQAMALYKAKKYNDAIDVLQKSLKVDPGQAVIYNLLGLIYLEQNESIRSAIGSFEQAVRMDPNYAEAYYNLATTYAGAANRPVLAAEYFKKTLEADPNYVKAYFGLGWFTLTAKEDPGKALEYFRKAIASFPDFAEAHYGLGLSYVQLRKASMALQSVSRLRALGREDLAAYLEMAIRGGSIPGSLKEEDRNPMPMDSENPSPQGMEEKVDREMPAELQERPVSKKQAPESPDHSGAASGDNVNPFKLT